MAFSPFVLQAPPTCKVPSAWTKRALGVTASGVAKGRKCIPDAAPQEAVLAGMVAAREFVVVAEIPPAGLMVLAAVVVVAVLEAVTRVAVLAAAAAVAAVETPVTAAVVAGMVTNEVETEAAVVVVVTRVAAVVVPPIPSPPIQHPLTALAGRAVVHQRALKAVSGAATEQAVAVVMPIPEAEAVEQEAELSTSPPMKLTCLAPLTPAVATVAAAVMVVEGPCRAVKAAAAVVAAVAAMVAPAVRFISPDRRSMWATAVFEQMAVVVVAAAMAVPENVVEAAEANRRGVEAVTEVPVEPDPTAVS